MAATVISKLFEYMSRVMLIVYGVVGLLAIFWHLGAIYPSNLIRLSAFSFSALLVGLSPIFSVHAPRWRFIYLSACILGVISAAYLGFQYAMTGYRSWADVGEQCLLIGCFIFMAVRGLRKTKGSALEKDKGVRAT